MTEGMPRPPEETRELHRSLTERVLDRATEDPAWRQQLIDDPEAAIQAANFPETQQLQQMSAGAPQGEVVGQHSGGGPGSWNCGWFWWWSPWWGWQQYWWTDSGGPGGGMGGEW
jgi:hypothetical protein